MKNIFFTILIALFAACNVQPSVNNNTKPVAKVSAALKDTTDCVYNLINLIKHSDFMNNPLVRSAKTKAFSIDSLTIDVDYVTDSSIMIHIYRAPPPDSTAFNETVAWLELDMKRKQLKDITKNRNNPKLLNFNPSFLQPVNTNCLTTRVLTKYRELVK